MVFLWSCMDVRVGLWRRWAPKNWCFWTVVLEKTLESPLDCKEIQPVHSEGDQPWVFFGRTDAKAETPVLWPPHGKSWFIGKDSDAGRDWGQEEKGTTEDGWMASLTRWTWVWVNSGSWWWTGRPGVLRFMGSQRVGHDWVTELNWTLWYLGSWRVRHNWATEQQLKWNSPNHIFLESFPPQFPVLHELPDLAQTEVHRVHDAIQPSHPLLSPSPPTFKLSKAWE